MRNDSENEGPMEEPATESWLSIIGSIPYIGDWVATIVGLVPVFPVLAIYESVGEEPGGWYFVLAGVLLTPWLIFLERWQGFSIKVPVLPIKLLWVTPVLVVMGAAEVLGFG
jgi:hypothetical protein